VAIWVAGGFGALDLADHEFAEQGYELALIPGAPGAPRFLWGDGAEMWRRLAEEPADDSDLDADERATLLELAQMALVTDDDADVSARASRPWLSSALHELVYALIAHVARQHGIEPIFLKGPTLHRQGLRVREHSGDVDCWVLPGQDIVLAEAMREWGWTPCYTAFTGTSISHSLTLAAGAWGCAIDVHTRFPGSTIAAPAAFELVAETAEQRTFAGTPVRTPSKPVHAVLFALHEMRPIVGSPPGPSQRENALRALVSGGPATVDVARDLGAEFVLGELLQEAFPEEEIDLSAARMPSDWPWRSTTSATRRHAKALRLVRWRDRPRVLFRLVWPSRRMIEGAGAAGEESIEDTAGARVRRVLAAALQFGRERPE